MAKNPAYQFVNTDMERLVATMVAAYEEISGVSVQPASPEKLFILWVANVVIQERVLNNYTGNQNIPSRASGENLDALGELFFVTKRPEAQAAVCTMGFHISKGQESAILIPAGTRVTGTGDALVWETTDDVYVKIGETYVENTIRCQIPGTIGNDYAIGQINTIVDVFPYYDHCANVTVSDSGADRASDEAYYQLMRSSMDGYSDAGAKGGYIYFAKKVSTEIADVVANTPSAGRVNLYVLMQDGSQAGAEIKSAVLAACNAETVRPLTDLVTVEDLQMVPYNIKFTYYIPSDMTRSSTEIQKAVENAVLDYIAWQRGKLGRDINPSELIGRLMQTGIKRVVLEHPVFTPLRDGSDNSIPQVADIGEVTVTSGGHEDE